MNTPHCWRKSTFISTCRAFAYGIQLVYNDPQNPIWSPWYDGDAVLLPSGYHPNVAVPGHRIAFLWAMAAHREVEDRQYGVVNVQPEFKPDGASRQDDRQ
jgi:5-deoxy-glucuronate isomerase